MGKLTKRDPLAQLRHDTQLMMRAAELLLAGARATLAYEDMPLEKRETSRAYKLQGEGIDNLRAGVSVMDHLLTKS